MKILSRLLAVVLVACAQQSMAPDATRVVGAVTIDMEDQARSRKIVSEVWFEAAPGAKAEPFAARPVFRPIPVARDAGPYPSLSLRPLVIISHGNFGSRFSHAWLASELVQTGYLVLSTSHPGTSGEDQTAAGRYRLWDRSRDVSFAIDEILKHPKWGPLIDPRRIGFVGHSFGGWTGVSLAGGRYDPAKQRAFCEKSPKKDFYCEGTLKDDITSVPATDAGGSFKDGRIKAFYIMAAGPGQGFLAESLNSITAPFIVDTAQFDSVLEPQANSSFLARHIVGAREVIRPVGHFVYTPLCIGRIPSSAGPVSLICSDPDGVDRDLVQKEVARNVIQLFNEKLPGQASTR